MKARNASDPIALARMRLSLMAGARALGLVVWSGCSSKLYAHSALVDPGASAFAELTIIREKVFAGGTTAIQVRLDGAAIVKLRVGHCAVVRLQPRIYRDIFVKLPGAIGFESPNGLLQPVIGGRCLI